MPGVSRKLVLLVLLGGLHLTTDASERSSGLEGRWSSGLNRYVRGKVEQGVFHDEDHDDEDHDDEDHGHEGHGDEDHGEGRPMRAPPRRKRNLLFSSGVKLCGQETLEQLLQNHLEYFHLRVCQETVWEAYKIFWDRLPEREEFHDWLNRCQGSSVSVMEIGRFFSQSEEHVNLIRTRVNMAAAFNRTEPAVHSGEDTWTGERADPPKGETVATVTQAGTLDMVATVTIDYIIQKATSESLLEQAKDTSPAPDTSGEEEDEDVLQDIVVKEVEKGLKPGVSPEAGESPSEEEPVTLEVHEPPVTESVEDPTEVLTDVTSMDEVLTEVTDVEERFDDITPTVFLLTHTDVEERFDDITSPPPELEAISGISTEIPSKPSILTDNSNMELGEEFPGPSVGTPELMVDVTVEPVMELPRQEDEGTPLRHGEVSSEDPEPGTTDEDAMEATLEEEERKEGIEGQGLEEEEAAVINDEVTKGTVAATVATDTLTAEVIEPEEGTTETAEEEPAETERGEEGTTDTVEGTTDTMEGTTDTMEGTTGTMEAPVEDTESGPQVPVTTELEMSEPPAAAGEDMQEEGTPPPGGGGAWQGLQVVEVPQEADGTEDEEVGEVPQEAEGTEVSEVVPGPLDLEEEEEEVSPVIVVLPDDTEQLVPEISVEEKPTEHEDETTPGLRVKLSEGTEVEIPTDTQEFQIETTAGVLDPSDSTPEAPKDSDTVAHPGDGKESLPASPSEREPTGVEVQTGLIDTTPTTGVVGDLHAEVAEEEGEDLTTPGSSDEFTPEEAGDVSADVAEGEVEVLVSTEAGQEVLVDVTTPGMTLEVTTKYTTRVEYNNGNFPEPTERPTEKQGLGPAHDDILGNNGFGLEDQQEETIGNEIDDTLLRPPRPLRDRVVELQTRLRGETFTNALRDPGSLQHQLLARQFSRRIQEAFDKLPGFKNVYVVEFRPQKDVDRGLVVMVHYAITVEVDSAGISNHTLDLISLQNTLVERDYPGSAEEPTVVYTITDLRNYITEALHRDTTSLETEPTAPQQQTAEDQLPSGMPTSLPAHTYDNMDNVLAAERPPDAPPQEVDSTDVFLKKEDFLLGTFDPWKGSRSDVASENDVFLLDESTVPPVGSEVPEKADALGKAVATTDNHGNIEAEGFLRGDLPSAAEDETPRGDRAVGPPGSSRPPGAAEEDGGSGFSGDGAGSGGGDAWVREPAATSHGGEGAGGQDVLPPPDLEGTEEEEEEEQEEGAEEKERLSEGGAQSSERPQLRTLEAPRGEEPVEPALDPPHASTAPPHASAAPPRASAAPPRASAAPPRASAAPPRASAAPPHASAAPPHASAGPPPILWTLEASGLHGDSFLTRPDGPAWLDPDEQDELLVLEEQHVGVGDYRTRPGHHLTSSAELSEQDLAWDQVMVVTTATAAAPVNAAGADLVVPLSPEKESPFTRISDAGPEDDENVRQESYHHGDHIPVSRAPSALPPTTHSSLTYQEVRGHQEVRGLLAGPNDLDLVSFDLFQFEDAASEGDNSGSSSVAQGWEQQAVAMPTAPGRALTVFFSLRVTNMMFSMNLFNKSSSEYKALEQSFLQLLVPHLQSNLSSFQKLEILNFRNGSVVVNSRVRLGGPLPRGVTTVVYLILEDFADTVYQAMNMDIDKHSLEVESGDQADPCKFQACNEFSRCLVNRWSGEAECVCDAGFISVDATPCQSVCELQTHFCLNDGKCDVIPGRGAICRCRVGENWWYRGEHCEEFVSEPLVVAIVIVSVAAFLLVASGVIFFLVRTLRDQDQDSEDPLRRGDSAPTMQRSTKFDPTYESDTISAHYYRRYDDDLPRYSLDSSTSTSLTTDEIQERLRVIELYAKDEHYVRQTQVFLERRASPGT